MTSTIEREANTALTLDVLQNAVAKGITEFCVCPGGRNSPLVMALTKQPHLKSYLWYEERSAAFFALGRARATGRPVAVVVTSGTAAGELLPAVMEAYYTGVPLLLITADRPRRFRGTAAPQTAEQVNLFGIYTPYSEDIALNELCNLCKWDCLAPAHLNICFEEPLNQMFEGCASFEPVHFDPVATCSCLPEFERFLQKSRCPFVVVNAVKQEAREAVTQLLLQLNAPVYFEGVSGLREEPCLSHLQVKRVDRLWSRAEGAGYSIDGILRIGGIPTFRPWRDLEDKQDKIHVCSLSEHPFSGLSWGSVETTTLNRAFPVSKQYSGAPEWLEADREAYAQLERLFSEEPQAEPSLFRALSMHIPEHSFVYLGNSMPIREWDQAATFANRGFAIGANRGLNGIDGQVSTFLGMCDPQQDNWAILGDLTTLYDLAGPWIVSQLQNTHLNIVVVNNGGGKIFSRVFGHDKFQNPHQINFEPFAALWNLKYERWETIPDPRQSNVNRIIEIVPDEEATERFYKRM